MRALILSDLHIPYHSTDALKRALDYGRDERASTVIINGDMMDCAMISRYDKTRATPSLLEEVEIGREVLAMIRRRLPQVRIIYRLGNHEERLEHYLMRYAREIAQLGVITMGSLLACDKMQVQVIERRQEPIMLGKLAVLHGHEIGSAASVNIAHAVLRRVMSNVLVGHWHRRQSETLRTYKGDYIGCWVVGCLCDLEPTYAPINQWQHGFALVDVRKSGTFFVRNHVVIGGDIL